MSASASQDAAQLPAASAWADAAPATLDAAGDAAVAAPPAADTATAADGVAPKATAIGHAAVVPDQPEAGADAAAAAAAMPAADATARALASTDAPRTAATATTTAQAGTPAAAPQSPASVGTLGGAVFALVLVVALILVLSWLAKRMPGMGGGAGAHPSLRIVGALALGPRDRLVVVEVGETQLLLGVGAGGTRTLHTLDQPLPAAAAKSTPAFAQLLARHLGKKS